MTAYGAKLLRTAPSQRRNAGTLATIRAMRERRIPETVTYSARAYVRVREATRGA